MEKFNLISILVLYIPEVILNIYLSFLVTFKTDVLPLKDDRAIRKANITKLIYSASLMIFTNAIYRTLLPSLGIALIAEIITTTFIFMYVYKISFASSSLKVLTFIGFLIMIEAFYMPKTIEIFFNDLNSYFNASPGLKALCSLPERFLQVWAIITCWNLKNVAAQMKIFNIRKKWFVILFSLLIFVEASYFYQYLYTFKSLNMNLRIIEFIGCIAICFVNYSFFMLYLYIVRAVGNTLMKRG